jgi:hypothetical protein
MKGIIIGPRDDGDGVYTLVTENGEALCSHMCSSAGYAYGDLYGNRPERAELFAKHEITEVVHLKDSGVSREEMLKRNKDWWESLPKDTK